MPRLGKEDPFDLGLAHGRKERENEVAALCKTLEEAQGSIAAIAQAVETLQAERQTLRAQVSTLRFDLERETTRRVEAAREITQAKDALEAECTRLRDGLRRMDRCVHNASAIAALLGEARTAEKEG